MIFSMSTNFSDYLTRMMRKRRMSPTALARITGISRVSVYRHKDGETEPSATDREKYAEAFDMKLGDFDAGWIDNTASTPSNIPSIPEWPEMYLAASHFVEGNQDAGYAEELHHVLNGRFRVTIRGNCMIPDWKDGELIEFELLRDNDFIVGNDYYIECNEGATFKRCFKSEDRYIEIGCADRSKMWKIKRRNIRRAALALWYLGNRRSSR